MSANKAHPQVYPMISHLEAFLADMRGRLEKFNLIEMRTFCCYGCLVPHTTL